jgi:hypothetical protein
MQHAPQRSRIFFFWKGVGNVSFLFFILSKGACECFLFYFGSWVALHVTTQICFALVCKLVVKIQSSFILFTYMGESDGQYTRGKLLFWFSLQGGCGGPKRVFLVHHVDKALKVNFCFGLVCKVVLEVQRSSILFTYIMGMPHVQKTRDFYCFLIKLTFFMNSFLSSFLIMSFCFFCSLITSSLCYGETKSFRKLEFFHLDQCQLVSYVNNF